MKVFIKPLVFYIIATSLFITDILLAAFFGQSLTNGIVALTINESLQRASPFRLTFLLLLISLQSFFWYDRFGLQLIIMAPVTIVLTVFWHALRITPTLKYLLLILTMAIQIIGIEHYMLHLPLTPTCIFFRIGATLILMIMLSLK